MDSVLDRLSALETIWRVTTTSNISAFEEFDVFTCKKEETTVKIGEFKVHFNSF